MSRSVTRSADRGGDEVAAGEAKAALNRARARVQDVGERFSDLYVWAFTLALLTIWTLSFARQTFTGRTCQAGDSGCVLQQEPAYTAVAVLCLGLGGLLLTVAAVGPVSAERAAARWLLGTTADRAVLLRGPLAGVATGAALGGVLLGLLTSMAAQGGGLEPAPLGLGAGLGAVLGALVPVALLVPQTRTPSGRAPGGRVAAGLALFGLALLTSTVLAGDALPEVGFLPDGGVLLRVGWLLTAVLTVLLVALLVLLLRPDSRLAELSDAQLARGREVVDAVSDSAMMMNASMVSGLQRRRADQRRGRHHSRPLRCRGGLAFLVADLRQLGRRWRSVALTFLALPAVLVAGEGFGYGAAILLGALVAVWAGRQAGQGLRTWLGSAGLRRSVRLPAWQVTCALTVPPTLACALVAVPAVVLVGGPWWGGLHLAAAGLAATMRAADPMPADLGAVITTPAGALPTGLLLSVLHGPDLAVGLALSLVLVGEPYVLAASLFALGWQVARKR